VEVPFTEFPLGHSINGSPHSVCVSLPTLRDVINYEHKDPATLATFAAGYPRFHRNPLIEEFASKWNLDTGAPLLPTWAAAEDLCAFIQAGVDRIEPAGPYHTVRLRSEAEKADAAAFLQHTGCGISSREAEKVLVENFHYKAYPELRSKAGPEADAKQLRNTLHQVYGTATPEDVFLARSGMNAFYAGFRALQYIQLRNHRDLWIHLGWLYLDTTRVLERFSPVGVPPLHVVSPHDLPALRQIVADHGHRIAGIVTEFPTNPLVESTDLEELRSIADRCKAALVLDPTLVNAYNVHILPFADLHINSLTKYAAQDADVMMGALALCPHSPFYEDLWPLIDTFISPPSAEDCARLAVQIPHTESFVEKVNATTIEVAEFLMRHPGVDQLWWARRPASSYNYNWLQHKCAGPGGVLTFTSHKPMEAVYNALRFVKSPSFGARFTMICPFLYLAHYDLVSTPEGRSFLERKGLPPNLLRLSLGLESPEAIMAELDRALT
jgi:cystathionine gamma-synthase